MTAQATFCSTLVDEWIRCGVRHAVIAPGSRSTPLALALAEDDRIAVHIHHDERSAAFMALGIGLATASPAVVLTTSGTAAVELHPAVVEADLGRVPLIACTADRPPELWDVAAPQTIDQTHLFGRSVRWFVEPGVADDGQSHAWRSLASRAVAETTGSPAGPVHCNLSFRDPLVGAPSELPPARPDGPWHRHHSATSSDAVELVRGYLQTPRGVFVAGRGAPVPLGSTGAMIGWPVLCDARAGCGGPANIRAFDSLLRDETFSAQHRPDIVVRVGEALASKVLSQWLADLDVPQLVIDRDGHWVDPSRTANDVVAGDPRPLLMAAAKGIETGDPGWLTSWRTAEEKAQDAIDTILDSQSDVTEPGVARILLDVAPGGSHIVAASSMPIRDIEWYGRSRPDVTVHSNRGANGIDGVVSTAAGVAIGSSAATAALVGDIALLHDTNGLLNAQQRGIDLVLVIVQNDGGGIFSFLPQATELSNKRFEQLFGTPHGVDPAALAEAHSIEATTVQTHDEAAEAIEAAYDDGGVRMVVAPTDRTANVAVHASLGSLL